MTDIVKIKFSKNKKVYKKIILQRTIEKIIFFMAQYLKKYMPKSENKYFWSLRKHISVIHIFLELMLRE